MRVFLLVLALAVQSLSAAANATAETPPVRVATLLPFVEEAIAHAGDRAIVVASVRKSMHHSLAEGLVDLGNPHSPNLETLAGAKADLVIGDRGIHGRFEASMAGLGARVLLIDTSGVEATLASLLRVSKAIGGSASLDERVAAAEAEIASLSVGKPLSVLTLFGSPGTFYVMTERAWLGDLASGLGYSNAIEALGNERFPGLVPVSDEAMAVASPDLVLLVAHGNPRKIKADLEERTKRGGAWAGLGRAKLGIHVLDPELFSANPGLDLVAAARELVALSKSTPGVAAQ